MKQFKNLILAGALAVGLAGFAVSCNKYGDDIEEIRNELASLRTGQVATVESQLASLQGTVSGLTTAKDALQSTVSGLESQLNALKNSAASAEDVAAVEAQIAALEADIAALKAADAALEAKIAEINKTLETFVTLDDLDATLASYATVKEVAEAVAEVQAALDKYVKSNDETVAAEVAKLEAAIAKAQEEAVAAAGKAFEAAFQTSFDAAAAAANLVDASALKAEVDAYDAKIKAYIAAAILDNGGNVNEEIGAQISEAIANLQKLLSGRLTSVVLIPELYVNGIEAIGLKSFGYTEKTVTSTDKKEEWETVVDKTTGVATQYSAGAFPTEVRYHVSPAHLTAADIEAPEFVYESAETRVAVKENLLNVIDWTVEGGELVMTVNKASGARISNNTYGKINTAAVRVPIAEKNLVEGEANAIVYSDYARLYETTVTPQIAALIDHSYGGRKEKDGIFECTIFDEKTGLPIRNNDYHFFGSYSNLQSNSNWYASNEIVYNESYDLMKMVTGCYHDYLTIDNTSYYIGKEITKEELAELGFEFRFAIPTLPNISGENGTDQQVFAKLDGSIISSKLPNGVTNNKAAVGKTPIVRVELVDTNTDKIVDVRYFMIEWVEKSLTSASYDKTFDYTLRCGGFVGEINWEEVVNEILANVGEDGISYDEFLSYYRYHDAKLDASEDNREHNGSGFVYEPQDTYTNEFTFVTDWWSQHQHSAAFVWTLTDEQIGQVMDINGNLLVKSKHLKVTIPANSGSSEIVLNLTVNIKLPVLPAFNGTQSTFWEKPGEVANIYPVIYNSPTASEYVRYEYDFDRLFADNQIVKNMLPCGKWDLQFAPTQDVLGSFAGVNYTYQSTINPTGNISTAVSTPNNGYMLTAVKAGGLSLLPAGVAAAFEFANFAGYNYGTAAYDGRAITDGAWYSAEKAPLKDGVAEKAATHKSVKADITLNVIETNETTGSDWGKSILTMSNERGKYVDDKLFAVNVWAAVNDYNPYLVKTFNIRFIAPFYVNTKAAGKFTDMVVSGSEVKVSDLLTMTDFNGYTVGKTNGTTEKAKYATALWHYYNVEEPVWNLDQAMTNLKKVGDNYEADVEMDAKDAKISAATRFGEGALALSADGTKVIFKNVSGVPIESNVQIFIPVTVTHKWGTFTQYISVTLQPRQ